MEIYLFVSHFYFFSFFIYYSYSSYSCSFDCLDWAVQNQKLEAVSFLLENYEVDVLQKNSFGRSVLTDAFQTGNTDIIALCLSHSSSSEERLLSVDKSSSSSSNSKNNESSKDNENSNDNNTDNDQNTQVIHEFDLNPFISALVDNSNENQLESTNNEEYRSRKTFKVRELPITRADNPFGGITTPEDDTTGLSIWPSAILMARYAIAMKDLLKDKVVMELGCGCGVPGLAVGIIIFFIILIFFIIIFFLIFYYSCFTLFSSIL